MSNKQPNGSPATVDWVTFIVNESTVVAAKETREEADKRFAPKIPFEWAVKLGCAAATGLLGLILKLHGVF